MAAEIEGASEAAAAGIVAHPADAEADETPGEAGGSVCLNCGATLTGEFCHRCGQSGHVHRTLTAWWHDLIHGVLHLDGKLWRTLLLLTWRPGELTRRYIEGERAKFVSPLALFLFSIFLMFAVFSTVGGPFTIDGGQVVTAEAARELEAEAGRVRARIAELRAERNRLIAAGERTVGVNQSLRALEAELRVLRAAGGLVSGGDRPRSENDMFRQVVGKIATGENDLPPRVAASLREVAETNPSLLFYKIQTSAYKFSWVLIPISVPFLWLLLFWKRRFKFYDHTVFVTYSLAFMTLGVIALSLLRPLGLGAGVASLAAMTIPPLHMYRQLKGAYGLSRFGAIWRAAMLMAFALAAGTLFLMLLLTLGALT